MVSTTAQKLSLTLCYCSVAGKFEYQKKYDVNVCKQETSLFLLVHISYETTSVCIESALDVYRNRVPLVLKWLCIETNINLLNLPRLHCTYDAMHFGIDTTWRTADAKKHFSFKYNWSANQKNYSTSWLLEQRKTFIKWILIGKAEEVLGERFFSSVISESRETTRYRKRSLSWNPWACFHSFFEFSQTFTSVSKTR